MSFHYEPTIIIFKYFCPDEWMHLQPEGEYERDMESHPMDFADGVEKLRGNMNAEFERTYDPLHSDHSVTPGSPGM
jgi:hypothetical protein